MRAANITFVTSDDPSEKGFYMHELVMSEAQLAVFRGIQTREAAILCGYDVVKAFVQGRYDEWLDFTLLRGELHLNPFVRYYKFDAKVGPRCRRHYRMAYGMSNAMRLKSYAANPIPKSLYDVLTAKEGAVRYTHMDEINMARWISNEWHVLSPVFFAYVCRVHSSGKRKPEYMSDGDVMATWLATRGDKPKKDVQHRAFDARVRMHAHMVDYIGFMTRTYQCEPKTYRIAPDKRPIDNLYLMLHRPLLQHVESDAKMRNMHTVQEHFMATQDVSEADMLEAFGEKRAFFEGYLIANIVHPSKIDTLRLDKHHTLCCKRIPERVLKLSPPPKRARTMDEEIEAIGKVMLE